MLILSRKVNQKIQIDDDITITVTKIGTDAVKLGIDAPADTIIMRPEILHRTPRPKDPPHGPDQHPVR